MPQVKTSELVKKAKKEKRAVGSFNVLNMEMIKGVIRAAEKNSTPVIMQVTSGAIEWAGYHFLVPVLISAAKKSKIDIAVHLDHTTDIKLLKRAIDDGFSSVMYDGSHFDLNKNVNETIEVIKYAHSRGVEVEAEIGKVGGKEDGLVSDSNEVMTKEIAVDFFNKTKPDFLAIAFGTAHGLYKGDINLDFNLIQTCSKEINAPLVMHGSSGISHEDIKNAIQSGISKVNVGTDLLVSNFNSVRKFLNDNPSEYNIRKIHEVGIEAIEDKVTEYIKIFNQK